MNRAAYDALLDRKSVRAFDGRPVPGEVKDAILLAATRAPTAGNQQLYTIIDVTDPALKQRLSVTCDDQPFIAEAPMVLIFLADCRKWRAAFEAVGASPRAPGVGDLMLSVGDATAAAQNAVIAAECFGLGSCYIGDVMERCEAHRELLRLPQWVFPAAMLVIGYPTEQQESREKPGRCPMATIARENAYRDMSADELRDMLSWKAGARPYEEWMRAFCARKYNSDFAREMTRSVGEYLKDFEAGDDSRA